MSESKPGYALADRFRERSKRARSKYQRLVKRAFPEYEEPTFPHNNIPLSESPTKVFRRYPLLLLGIITFGVHYLWLLFGD